MVGGVTFMVAMITLARFFVLPRIYVCPEGAICHRSLDPFTTPVVRRLQTVLDYSLRIGTLIAAIGLTRLVAYQSWLSMKRQGTSLKTLNRNIAALNGSMWNSFLLLLKQPNRALGLFILCQFAITAIIPLILSFSISSIMSRDHIDMEFTYPGNMTLPVLFSSWGLDLVNMPSTRVALATLENWVSSTDPSWDTFAAVRGTYVVRDNRTIYALDPQPSGPRIQGSISCRPLPVKSVYSVQIEGVYNISYTTPRGSYYFTPSNNTMFSVYRSADDPGYYNKTEHGTLVVRLIWMSQMAGVIPNATTSSDGRLHLAECEHQVWASNITRLEGTQYLIPSNDTSPYSMPEAALNFILIWWNLPRPPPRTYPAGRPDLNMYFPLELSCRRGVLSPLGVSEDKQVCALNDDHWTTTLSAMVEALVDTAKKNGTTAQILTARAVSISRSWWWLQGIIPLSALLLYIVCLGYTVYINRTYGLMKQLDVIEVVTAYAQETVDVDHVDESVEVGGMGSWS